MAGQLIPPPELAPPPPDHLTSQQRVSLWVDLMNTADQFLLAGLRREIGPTGDLPSAYRAWYAEQMAEHDRTIIRMLQELSRRAARCVR